MPCLIMVCLFFTACDKDDGENIMLWSIDNQSTENIQSGYEHSVNPKIYIEANYKGGDVVLTCKNYDLLNPIMGNSNTYDCGWATITTEANQVKIHFPYNASDVPAASEQVTVSAKNGRRVVNTTIRVARTFGEDQPDPEPQPLPEKYKFKLTRSGFIPFMNDDFELPSPLDQVIFRITDINGDYNPFDFPDYTQYYDSIVWSAKDLPNTVRIYESKSTSEGTEVYFKTQWGSHFFKSGTVKTYLKGYRNGKVEYADELDITLYERDFLCFDWTNGSVILQKPTNIGVFCLLDTDYEYQVNDTREANGVRYSKITPLNHKHHSEADFLVIAQEAIKTLMKNSIGDGQKADGKESLFKCLPDGVEAGLFWENKTTRMLLLHQLPDESIDEKYYLHIESSTMLK